MKERAEAMDDDTNNILTARAGEALTAAGEAAFDAARQDLDAGRRADHARAAHELAAYARELLAIAREVGRVPTAREAPAARDPAWLDSALRSVAEAREEVSFFAEDGRRGGRILCRVRSTTGPREGWGRTPGEALAEALLRDDAGTWGALLEARPGR